MPELHFKDHILDELAIDNNIAQFISISPTFEQRFCRVSGYRPNYVFNSIEDGVTKLLKSSVNQSVNIRTFYPDKHQSCDFVPNLCSTFDILYHINRLILKGLYLIIHETIPLDDGGCNCIIQNNIIEFAPGVIPRFVENSHDPVSTFDKDIGFKFLSRMYPFIPKHIFPENTRVEFSIHPKTLGWRDEHLIIWELEYFDDNHINPSIKWPNTFSKFIGDKTYGLLIADILGFRVPYTTVFSRDNRFNTFSFGTPTGSDMVWMRTCPNEQVPGKYTTVRGWCDPYDLMRTDDPTGDIVVACLAQHEVSAQYSGALLSSPDGPIYEGVSGFGDSFMVGDIGPIELPRYVINDVLIAYDTFQEHLGPVRFEWVHDGRRLWILQLHVGTCESNGRIIVPGECSSYTLFDIRDGLEWLRQIIYNIPKDTGIEVYGNIGMTSHIADVLRKSNIPSRMT